MYLQRFKCFYTDIGSINLLLTSRLESYILFLSYYFQYKKPLWSNDIFHVIYKVAATIASLFSTIKSLPSLFVIIIHDLPYRAATARMAFKPHLISPLPVTLI